MKRSRFTEEQIIGVLREQVAGMGVAEVCRKRGISQPTFYGWKAKFGGMSVSDAKRLKHLEEQVPRLHQGLRSVTQWSYSRAYGKRSSTSTESRSSAARIASSYVECNK